MKIYARIKPNSKRSESIFTKLDESGNMFYEVIVRAPAIDNRANKSAIKLIAKEFNVPKTNVRLVSGASSRFKVFEIEI